MCVLRCLQWDTFSLNWEPVDESEWRWWRVCVSDGDPVAVNEAMDTHPRHVCLASLQLKPES